MVKVDAQTFRDLEIFQSEGEAPSLFDALNLTRTGGGGRALRARMERPFSDAGQIRSTQEALSYILRHRSQFDDLPANEYTANRVERHQSDLVYLIQGQTTLEFAIGVFLLRLNHGRDYDRIIFGVQMTCRMLRELRQFVSEERFASASGELDSILDEVRQLLARSALARIPDESVAEWGMWRILRVDQTFRLTEKSTILRLLHLIYQADALVALADVTRERDFVFPDVEEGELRVCAEELVHPLIDDPVANTVRLDQERRLLFLTGPNMAGKTTYLRTFATALYMAHLGIGVPAKRFSFVPAEALFSSIAHSDDLRGGVSYFRAEALRVRVIAEALASGKRVVAILDEPFKGTNVKDALDASLAILQRLAARENSLFMFSSHLIELSQTLSEVDGVDCHYFEAEEAGERLRFSYVLHPGVSSQRLGMRLLREEGIFRLLDKE